MKCKRCAFRRICDLPTVLAEVMRPEASIVIPQSNEPLNAAATTRPSGVVLVSLCLSVLLSSLGTSIANVGLPVLVVAFDSDFAAVQWVVLAYLLAVTSLVVSAGRLGDIVGHRRLLIAGIALFTVSSVICGLAPTLPLLILGRFAQGLGAAIMMALGLAFARDIAPKEQTGRIMGLIGAMSSVGTTLGPATGGLLIAWQGWRAIFFLNLLLGVLTFGLSCLYLPRGPKRAEGTRTRFDLPGTLLLASSLAAYALAMTLGHGGVDGGAAALLVAAACGVMLFLFVETQTAAPLIRPALLRDPVLALGFATSAAVATVMMATLIVGPFFLTRALGLHAGEVGLAMAAGPLVAAVIAPPAGWLCDRYGSAKSASGGLIVLAIGTTLFALPAADRSLFSYLAVIVVISIGYGVFQTANNTTVMATAAADQRGVISGLLNLSRNFGLISGASGMGAVFSRFAGSNDMTAMSPNAVAQGAAATFTVAAILAACALVASLIGQRESRNGI